MIDVQHFVHNSINIPSLYTLSSLDDAVNQWKTALKGSWKIYEIYTLLT